MRKDPHGNQLLPRMYCKHGAYWYVYRNKWSSLGKTYEDALAAYGRKTAPQEGMMALIEKVFERYERRVKAGKLKQKTLNQYKGCRKKIEAAFVNFAPNQVITSDITTFLDFHEDTPNMANRMLTVLKEVFDRGVRWGLCDTNPAYSVKRFEEGQRDRYLTDAEYKAIRDKANPYIKLMMDMCYITAQRIGDVIDIKHTDITRKGIYFEQEKGGKRLLVEATPELSALINDARALHKVQLITPYLFHPRGKATKYSYRAVRDCFDRACTLAKVTDAHLHDLRAKALTDADSEGEDAQKLAGHSTPSMTKRYLRLRQTDVVSGQSAVRILDNSLDVRQ